MFVSVIISSLLVVYPAIAITLPNGFTVDETQFLQIESRYATYESCDTEYGGCSYDCSKQVTCDGYYNYVMAAPCHPSKPYCVKNFLGTSSYCTSNFPTDNPECLTHSTNKFMCTENGEFPDPTDCTKYHVCNGTLHTIKECPSSTQYLPGFDPTGDYSCQFVPQTQASNCDVFYCDQMVNTFVFRPTDNVHYAFCIELGTTKKTLMFRCPQFTRHQGTLSPTKSVDCIPF